MGKISRREDTDELAMFGDRSFQEYSSRRTVSPDTVRQPGEYFDSGDETIRELMTQAEALDRLAAADGLYVLSGACHTDPRVIALEGDAAGEIFDRVKTGDLESLEQLGAEYEIVAS